MMTNDDQRGGRGVKNAQNLMTSYVNDPLRQTGITYATQTGNFLILTG